jgi:hypothetical protein
MKTAVTSQYPLPGLDPGIHVLNRTPFAAGSKAWVAGSSPAMGGWWQM